MRPISRRLSTLLAHPRLPWLAVGLALALCLPSLGAGISLDDYFHRLALRGEGVGSLRGNLLLDLFNFLPSDPEGRKEIVATGIIPWWSSPNMRGSFLRPVTAATHVLDQWLWPETFPLQHAHNLLWFALGLLAVAQLYREAGARTAPVVVGLAALLFALEDAHVLPAVWIANRNALLALAMGIWGVIWHLRWRRQGGLHRLALSLLFITLGLLSAEAALGAVGYMAAHQLTRDRRTPLVRRLMALLPVVLLVLAWRLAYNTLGYGASGLSLYLDPGADPLGFLSGLLERGPILIFHQWSQVNIDPWVALPRPAQLGLAAAGWLTIVGLGALLLPLLRRDRDARFWAVGMVLSSVPACGAFPMARLTLFTGIGAAALLAALAGDQGHLQAVERPMARGWRTRTTRVLLWAHGPLAAALLLFGAFIFPSVTAFIPRAARAVAPDSPEVADKHVVLVNGYDMYTMYFPAVRQVLGLVRPRTTNQLASMSSDLTVRREAPDTLTITAKIGFLGNSTDHLMWNRGHTFIVGQRRQRPAFTATVDRVTPDGRPLTVTFKFATPLEHDSLLLRAVVNGHIVPFTAPPVGGEVTLPWTAPAL